MFVEIAVGESNETMKDPVGVVVSVVTVVPAELAPLAKEPALS